MVPHEPINLREWIAPKRSCLVGRLFTCGRPGRATYGTANVDVPIEVIDRWEKGLPAAERLHIVSLLGRKNNGASEFVYYPFRSSEGSDPRPTFQEWLGQHYDRHFSVDEFPTVDFEGILPGVLAAATSRITSLLEAGHTVVVIDSAGAERTARVCEEIGYARSK